LKQGMESSMGQANKWFRYELGNALEEIAREAK